MLSKAKHAVSNNKEWEQEHQESKAMKAKADEVGKVKAKKAKRSSWRDRQQTSTGGNMESQTIQYPQRNRNPAKIADPKGPLNHNHPNHRLPMTPLEWKGCLNDT